jgi:hypothetical protein
MLNKLHKFIYENPNPLQIERIKIESDPDRVQEIQSKVEKAKLWLGERYVCHPLNHIRRLAKATS